MEMVDIETIDIWLFTSSSVFIFVQSNNQLYHDNVVNNN